MHNSFAFQTGTPGITNSTAYTFSGQRAVRLWETLAQVGGLYPVFVGHWNGLWETMRTFTQLTGSAYTAFPTASVRKITSLQVTVIPTVHRSYKEDNEVYKGKLGIS